MSCQRVELWFPAPLTGKQDNAAGDVETTVTRTEQNRTEICYSF